MASSQQTMMPASGGPTNNVSIRVIALAHATSQNEDIHLVLGLDTTVSQLKERLQQTLSQHPRPETQRLIYQGRPLTNGNATLRQTLRLDPVGAVSPPAHVLHLVVRDEQSTLPSNTHRPQTTQPQTLPANTVAAPQSASLPVPPPFNWAPQALPQGHPAQAMLQNVMQHHMAIHNQHHHQHVNNGQIPPSAGPGTDFNFPALQSAQNEPIQPTRTDTHQPSVSLSPPSAEVRSNTPTINDPPYMFHRGMTMTVEETIGPHGERVQRVVGGPILPGQVNPVERSASAPGSAEQPTNSAMPLRANINSSTLPGSLQQLHARNLANLQHPFGRLPTMPFANTAFGPTQQAQQSRNPVVYLLSSPTGPEALVFAPQHGLFTTHHLHSMTQPTVQSQPHGADQPVQLQQATPTQSAQQTPAVARNNDQGQVALRPQGPIRGQAQAQPGRREGEDLVALILQRGWLFLRLYMFIFVLSEPGTWRRYILLTIASLVCLLPRNNPFTDLFQAGRRHFDNLIGPPQPLGRPRGQPLPDQPVARNQTNNEGATLPESGGSQRNATGTQMPTPAEHARRLLREQEHRNPNTVRDTIYRIEQAAALFLASLIPGVGERHVRAREEARRLIQEEDERHRREEEERTQQQVGEGNNKSDDGPSALLNPSQTMTGASAVSTSVDARSPDATPVSVTATDEELRTRNGDNTTPISTPT